MTVTSRREFLRDGGACLAAAAVAGGRVRVDGVDGEGTEEIFPDP